jgi:primosomal protein N' (replication factor Y)
MTDVLPLGSNAPGPSFIEVAVPLPLPQALTYSVPPAMAEQAEVGRRARVRVGKRRLTGIIVGLRDVPPEGVTVRAVDAIVDREPLLTTELLELASWVSEYYLAPPGEVLRAISPPADTPWGDRRVWLTDAGALAVPRDRSEALLVDEVRSVGRATLAELQASTGIADLERVVGRLTGEGKLGISSEKRRGSRFTSAVELAAGELDDLRERCGRSVPGRQVVDLLATLERPATVEEVCSAVGCKPGVVRRLVSLGILRSFSQIERLGLDQHLLPREKVKPIRLRPDQSEAASAIERAVESDAFSGLLLHGMTGSGKTEVYLRGVTAALERGLGAILLVPEIALVPALASTLQQRYGPQLAILHSNLTGSERQQEWERVRQGEARVVLGPRSAVFAPVAELGLIVVDEEQDSAYKQDTTPRYNGRDLALLRGQRLGATVVLVSATPSLEARLNAERGKLSPLVLTERVGQGELPEGILVDLKEEGAVRRPGEVSFSDRLRDEIERSLRHNEQVILLRNRRGYAPVLLCRACGEDMRCEDCGLPRTFHKRDRRLLCHYCGSRLPAPSRCQACASDALEPVGAGTERVEEEFRRLFPDVSVDTLDRDSVRRPGSVAAVLERFGRGDTRVLVGTQMVSKGHHFPGVGLTAVLHADTYLGFPDFRAVERTYNLLTQLAGRAGRGERPGRIVIQTLHPEHYAIRAALAHDDEAFASEEMRFRRVFHYPPYTRMVQLLSRDRNRERAEAAIREINRNLSNHPLASEVRISGPAPAPFEKLRGRWRFQLLVRSASATRLRRMVRESLGEKLPSEIVVDVDPYELL